MIERQIDVVTSATQPHTTKLDDEVMFTDLRKLSCINVVVLVDMKNASHINYNMHFYCNLI